MNSPPQPLLIHKDELDPTTVTNPQLNRDIMRVALPSVGELMLSALCFMVDTMMVGHLGSWALTAVGLSSQPIFVLMIAFFGLNVGSTALVARMRGENDIKGMNDVLRQMLMLTTALSILLAVVGYIFAKESIVLMGAEPNIIAPGVSYMRILMVVFPLNMLAMTVAACLRGSGHTKAAMYMSLTSNIFNIPLNYILIYGKFGFPRLEVAGAAVATAISLTLSFIVAVVLVTSGRYDFRLSFRHRWRIDWDILRRIIKVGAPALWESVFTRAGILVYTRLVSHLGTIAYATHQAGISLLNLTFMNGQAFAIAATTLVGQSLGRNMPEMAKRYAKQARLMAVMVAFILSTVLFFTGGFLIRLYNSEPEVISLGRSVLKVMALCQPFMALVFITSGALKGAGETKRPMIFTLIGICVVRPITALFAVFVLKGGLTELWVGLFIDYIVRTLLFMWYFKKDTWLKNRI